MEYTLTDGRKIPELEAQLQAAPDQPTRINLLNEIAWNIQLSNRERGLQFAEWAYQLSTTGEFENNPYLPGLAESLLCMAGMNTDAGNYDQALSQALQANEILDSFPDEGREKAQRKAKTLGVVSWAYRCLGDYVVAAEFALEGLKFAQATGNRQNETGLLNVLSVIYAESNDRIAALETGQKVVEICREIGNVRGESIALNNLAMTHLELGSGDWALETCQESLRLARENGLESVTITALSTLGEIYLEIKDLAKAEENLLQGLSLARKNKAGSDELHCLLNLGKVYQLQQKNHVALTTFENALSLSHAANDRRGAYQCHRQMSEIYELQGDLEMALEHFKQFHHIKEQVLNETAVNKLNNLRISHEVDTLKKESEIHRLKNVELQAALNQVKQLSGLLPICAGCKKIRDDKGYWQDVAVYIRDHSEAEFSHGFCPDCFNNFYPGLAKKRKNKS